MILMFMTDRPRESYQRSYPFLAQAVRDLLARERLKLNRDRISRSNDMRYSTAASGEISDSSVPKEPKGKVLVAPTGEAVFVLNTKSVEHASVVVKCKLQA